MSSFNPNNLFYKMLKLFVDNRKNKFWSEEKQKDLTKKVVICNEGGSRCFGKDQLVVTDKGSVPISLIEKGDLVLTLNESNGKEEYKEVDCLNSMRNTKKTLKIKLKNGKEIIVTDDHEFYHEGAWVAIKHLLSLRSEKINNDKREGGN